MSVRPKFVLKDSTWTFQLPVEQLIISLVNELSDLVFAEGVNEACIDVVDGDPENHNDHVLGHSFIEGVSIL